MTQAPITELKVPRIRLDSAVVPARLVTQFGATTWEVPPFRVGHGVHTVRRRRGRERHPHRPRQQPEPRQRLPRPGSGAAGRHHPGVQRGPGLRLRRHRGQARHPLRPLDVRADGDGVGHPRHLHRRLARRRPGLQRAPGGAREPGRRPADGDGDGDADARADAEPTPAPSATPEPPERRQRSSRAPSPKRPRPRSARCPARRRRLRRRRRPRRRPPRRAADGDGHRHADGHRLPDDDGDGHAGQRPDVDARRPARRRPAPRRRRARLRPRRPAAAALLRRSVKAVERRRAGHGRPGRRAAPRSRARYFSCAGRSPSTKSRFHHSKQSSDQSSSRWLRAPATCSARTPSDRLRLEVAALRAARGARSTWREVGPSAGRGTRTSSGGLKPCLRASQDLGPGGGPASPRAGRACRRRRRSLRCDGMRAGEVDEVVVQERHPALQGVRHGDAVLDDEQPLRGSLAPRSQRHVERGRAPAPARARRGTRRRPSAAAAARERRAAKKPAVRGVRDAGSTSRRSSARSKSARSSAAVGVARSATGSRRRARRRRRPRARP